MFKKSIFAAIAIAAISAAAFAETDRGTKSLTVKTTERTWRANLERPQGAPNTFSGYRETLQKSGTDLIGRDTSIVVTRSLPVVKAETVTVNGKSITPKDIDDAIDAFMDKWRDEDIARAAAANPTAKQ